MLSPEFISYLPHVNACLNTTSAILLFSGYRFIRARNVAAHRACQIAALCVSILFLASYLTYHFAGLAARSTCLIVSFACSRIRSETFVDSA